MKFRLLAAAAALSLSASGAHAANLLANGGFESGALAPWVQGPSYSAGVDWSVTDSDAHSGLFAAINVGNNEIIQTFAGVSGSLISQVSFWQKHPSGTAPSYVELFFGDGSTNVTIVYTGEDWTFVDVTGLVNPSKIVTGIGIYGFCCSGTSQTLLDDLVIEARVAPVPEPTSWALMTLGMFGVGGYMRHRKSVRYSVAV